MKKTSALALMGLCIFSLEAESRAPDDEAIFRSQRSSLRLHEETLQRLESAIIHNDIPTFQVQVLAYSRSLHNGFTPTREKDILSNIMDFFVGNNLINEADIFAITYPKSAHAYYALAGAHLKRAPKPPEARLAHLDITMEFLTLSQLWPSNSAPPHTNWAKHLIYFKQARAHETLGDYWKAWDCYRRAATEGKRPDAMYRIAVLLNTHKDMQGTRQDLSPRYWLLKFLETSPGNTPILRNAQALLAQLS